MVKLGDIVLFTVPAGEPARNGSRQHPAIVTAVHSETCLNLTVFCDNGQQERWTSVMAKGASGDECCDCLWEPKE